MIIQIIFVKVLKIFLYKIIFLFHVFSIIFHSYEGKKRRNS